MTRKELHSKLEDVRNHVSHASKRLSPVAFNNHLKKLPAKGRDLAMRLLAENTVGYILWEHARRHYSDGSVPCAEDIKAAEEDLFLLATEIEGVVQS